MKKLGFDNLYCVFCGQRLERKSEYCKNCTEAKEYDSSDGLKISRNTINRGIRLSYA